MSKEDTVSQSQPGADPQEGSPEAPRSGGYDWPYFVEYCVTGNFIARAPFNTKQAALDAYRRMMKARSEYRAYSNDGSELFSMETAVGECFVALEKLVHASFLDIAKTVGTSASETTKPEGRVPLGDSGRPSE